jgi:hypothetical protein
LYEKARLVIYFVDDLEAEKPMNVFSGNPTLRTPLGIDEEMNLTCLSVAASILASSDSIDEQIIDRKLRQFAAAAVEEATANLARRGTPGTHCHYCGTDIALICGCEFATAFGCGLAGRYVCNECHTAHLKIGKHLREMFAAPRVMRSNCRKFLYERELYRAARSLEGGEDYEPGVSKGLTFHLSQASAEDQEPGDFRQAILEAFRASKFLDFQGLAAALAVEKDRTLLRAITRQLSRTSNSGQFYR